MTENKKVLKFIDESAALCQPDRIVWIDGSKNSAMPSAPRRAPPAR